jgi:predicted RNase H-like nuclease (RuvC/YqgF family)
MSDTAPRERRAIAELETLIQRLGDELASFRRRAQAAEGKLKELENREGGAASVALASKASKLERENNKLHKRLETAGTKTKQLLDRVRFLRQQAQGGGDR